MYSGKCFVKNKTHKHTKTFKRTDVYGGASAHGVSKVCLYRGVVLRGQTYPQARLMPFWPAPACMLNNNNTSKHENLTFTKACLTQYMHTSKYNELQYILDKFTTTDISHSNHTGLLSLFIRSTFHYLSLPFSLLHTDCRLSCFVTETFSIICELLYCIYN